MSTVTHLDAQKRFSPVEYPSWLLHRLVLSIWYHIKIV